MILASRTGSGFDVVSAIVLSDSSTHKGVEARF